MTRPPLTANGIEILARLRAGQSPAHIARVGWNRNSWSPADIATVARDWGHRDVEVAHEWNNGRKPLAREHGSPRGFYQHRSLREPACEPCRKAKYARDVDTRKQRQEREAS